MNRYFYVIPMLLAVSCGGSSGTDEGRAVLDIEKAIDNRRPFEFSEISEEIHFIPLDDTHKESFVTNIQKIGESGTGFYIQDRGNTPVKLFDKTGKFVATRGQIGRGPNEFINVTDLAVDYETDNLYLHVTDGGAMSLAAYDAAGKFIARATLPFDNRFLVFNEDKVIQLKRSPQNVYTPDVSTIGTTVPLFVLFSPDLQHQETIDTVDKGSGTRLVIDANGKDIRRMDITGDQGLLSDNGKVLLVKEERSDTVFYYRNGTLESAYALRMGGYAFPVEAYGLNPATSPGDSYIVRNLLESDRYLFVEAGGQKDGVTARLIFDRNNLSKGFSATGPDGRTGLFIDGIPFIPSHIRDNRLVGHIRALDIFDRRDRITDPKLKAIADSISEDSNPVIVVVDLKK